MDEFKNIQQAAKLIGVSAKTLRRYCQKRLINFNLTAGGHYRFRQSAIDLFLAQHRTVKPTDKRKLKKPRVKMPDYLRPVPITIFNAPAKQSPMAWDLGELEKLTQQGAPKKRS